MVVIAFVLAFFTALIVQEGILHIGGEKPQYAISMIFALLAGIAAVLICVST